MALISVLACNWLAWARARWLVDGRWPAGSWLAGHLRRRTPPDVSFCMLPAKPSSHFECCRSAQAPPLILALISSSRLLPPSFLNVAVFLLG